MCRSLRVTQTGSAPHRRGACTRSRSCHPAQNDVERATGTMRCRIYAHNFPLSYNVSFVVDSPSRNGSGPLFACRYFSSRCSYCIAKLSRTNIMAAVHERPAASQRAALTGSNTDVSSTKHEPDFAFLRSAPQIGVVWPCHPYIHSA